MKTPCLALIAGGCLLLVGCHTSETYEYVVTSAPNRVAADRARVRAVLGSVAAQTKMRELSPYEGTEVQINYVHKPAPTRLVAYVRPGPERSRIELMAHANGEDTLIELGRTPHSKPQPDFETIHRLLDPALGTAFESHIIEHRADNFSVRLAD